jgi:hypothetical protein
MDVTSDVTGGDLGGDGADDSKDSGGPDATPDSGADAKDASVDLPRDTVVDTPADVGADVPPDMVDAPGDPGHEGLPDVPPDGPDALGGTDVAQDHPPDVLSRVCSINSSNSPAWAKGWTGLVNPGLIAQSAPALLGNGRGLAAGADGTLWVAGLYFADYDFGTGSTVLPYSGGTKKHAFVAKFDPTTGLPMPSVAFGFGEGGGSDLDQSCSSIAAASGGNVGIYGSLSGEMDFTGNYQNGDGPSGNIGVAGADFLYNSSVIQFYAVFDGASSGTYPTVKAAHMVNLGSGAFLSIASNPTQDAIAICGTTSIGVTKYFNNGTSKGLITGLASGVTAATFGGGNSDIIVAKINASTGAVIWGQQYGGTGDQVCESVAIDNDGNVIIAGNYFGDLSAFGLTNVADVSGNTKLLYMARLNAADGSLTTGSAVSWAGTGVSDANGLTVDGSGNIFMAGGVATVIDFGTGALAYTGGGNSDAFVVKFNPSLVAQWAKSDGDSGYDQTVTSIAADSSGNVTLVGLFRGTLPYFGLQAAGNGKTDAFAAQVAADGSLLCAHSYGDATGAQMIGVVSVARTGPLADAVFVGGSASNTISFGSTLIVSPGLACTAVSGGCTGPTQTCEQPGGLCADSSSPESFISRLAP